MTRETGPSTTVSAIQPSATLRLRTGHELRVLEMDDCGARVEGEARLLPGTGVEIHVITGATRVRVRSLVVRSQVCRVTADSITYQSALSFEPAPPHPR
jgi:hypothetical protein